MALSAALNFRDTPSELPIKIKHLILISGTYDLSMSIMKPEFKSYEDEDLLNPKVLDYMFNHYIGSVDRAHPSVSPYFRDLSELPDSTLIVAEYDGVRSQTEALEPVLKAANINVTKHVVSGQTHNYLILRGAMCDGKDPAEIVSQALVKVFS